MILHWSRQNIQRYASLIDDFLKTQKDQQVSYKRVTRKCHMLKTFNLVLKTLWLNMKVKVPRVWCQDSKKSKYSCKSCKYGINDKAAAVHVTRIIFELSNKPYVIK
jgi:hypothetical protein